MRDQLRHERVVREPDLVALLGARVDPDPVRQHEPVEPPGLGQERPRILGVEPRLDRVAA